MIAPHRSRPRPTRRSTLARRALALVALAAAALAPLVPAAQEAAAPAPETLRPAKLMRLGERSAPVERVFYGRVTARATVDMAFQASGQLLRLPVEEGARVDRGALLGQLDLGPFERAERRASAELNRVRTDLNRLQNLGSDVVPQTRIDDTSTQLELAEVQHPPRRRRRRGRGPRPHRRRSRKLAPDPARAEDRDRRPRPDLHRHLRLRRSAAGLPAARGFGLGQRAPAHARPRRAPRSAGRSAALRRRRRAPGAGLRA